MSTSAINSRGVSYDYDSVMHYHSTAFGNGRITITRKDGSTKLGNTRGLSAKDVQQANLMYCNKQPVTARPPTGIAALFFFFPLAMFLTRKCSWSHKAAKFRISGNPLAIWCPRHDNQLNVSLWYNFIQIIGCNGYKIGISFGVFLIQSVRFTMCEI